MERDIENVIADLRRQRDRLDRQFAERANSQTGELINKLRELRQRMGIPADEPSDAAGDAPRPQPDR